MRSSNRLISKREEQRFLKASGEIFADAFPNPERIGCPGSQILKSVAFKAASRPTPPDFFDHLTCCSPCFVEYRGYLKQSRRHWQWRALAASIILAAAIGTGLWLAGILPLRPAEEPGTMVEQPSPAPNEVAVLDLRNRSPVRGQTEPQTVEPLTLSRPASSLLVTLPIGSEEGLYEVEIRQPAGDPVIATKANAERRQQNVILEMDLSLGNLDSGDYFLAIRRAGLEWMQYQIIVK